MQTDPGRGEALAAGIEAKARKLPATPQTRMTILTAQYFRAEALIQLNRSEAAEPIIEAALADLPATAADTKLHGDLLLARAGVASSAGKAAKALQDYQSAYRIFVRARVPRSQAIALMGIGSIYQDAGDFQNVLEYYGQAEDAFPGDTSLSLSSSNNQANALADLHQYRAAELKYRDALGYAKKLGSPVLEARILNNIAGTQIDTGQLDVAEATLQRGLGIAESEAGAAEWRPLLLGTKARLEVARHRPEAAIRLIEEAVRGKAPADIADQSYRDLHRTAFLAYKAVGDSRQALDHFEVYSKLDDEGRSLVTQTNASLLGAQFSSERLKARIANQKASIANQKASISDLKADQLRIQARQNALILGGLLAIVSIVVIALSLYLRSLRRSRNTIRGANETLSRVNVELEHALTAKSRFLATTSHEIRTPLNGVLGMTQVLLADPTVRSDVRERIALVHGAGESMRALVDDILEFAKIDAGNVDTVKADMDLHALLHTVVEFWQAQATTKGLSLTLELGDEVPRHIVEDERRVRQVLLNLLSNAIKFTLAGSVVVKASVVTTGLVESLAVAVVDTGVGIPDEAFETIFEKFSQLDTSTTRNFGGTGLGLAISRSIAEALGGDIGVSSTSGSGSTFTLTLPLVRAAPRVVAAPSAGSHAAAGMAQAHVMLVGGGLIGQSVIRNLLGGTVEAFSAAATLEAALAHPQIGDADVVIVDTSTVGSDLDELFQGLATGKARPRIVVILPAGDASAGAGLVADGVDCVLARPIGGAGLIAALEELFRGLDESVKKEQVKVDHGAA
ncbi:hypothetical protein KX816_12150 [Sphingosinicellaceae bacterium]|nr:hypothetical protein KX816_12150 [Sphingosinicellaceae bacterium]